MNDDQTSTIYIILYYIYQKYIFFKLIFFFLNLKKNNPLIMKYNSHSSNKGNILYFLIETLLDIFVLPYLKFLRMKVM